MATSHTSTSRPGFTLIELIAAGMLLAVIGALMAQLLTASSFAWRVQSQRQTALDAASNCLERLTAEPWRSITQEHAAAWTLSGPAAETLPDGKLAVAIDHVPGPPVANRLTVEVTWLPPAGGRRLSLQLTGFVHREATTIVEHAKE